MQTRVNQNPLLSRFHQYRSTANVPFENNRLIQNDPRLMQPVTSSFANKSENVIEQILKPVEITNVRNNTDVKFNYDARKKLRDQNEKIEYTDTMYKAIIKQPLNKPLTEIEADDLIVHRVSDVDKDIRIFTRDLENKKRSIQSENDALRIEYCEENYSKHKKAFEYNESFITNMAYEENLFDDNKKDCIEFYQKKQREQEEGKRACDQVLRDLMNRGLISEDEIPR